MAFVFMMSTSVAPGPGAPSPAPRRRPGIGDRPLPHPPLTHHPFLPLLIRAHRNPQLSLSIFQC